jgi:2-hydroxy-3-oxopropionate reductase
MAGNLARAGFELTVFNRTSTRAEDFVAHNPAAVAPGLAELAGRSDVVVTMLPGPPEVEAIVAGEGGLLEGMSRGTMLVDMSTSSPVLARGLAREAARRGIGMLDAPVSGGDVAAEQGTLSIMAGGGEADFARARPLFKAMGKTIVHVGGSGAGQVTKAANQVVVALTIEAVSEALVLGSAGGVAPEKILDVLSGGLAGNKVMEVKREKFLSHKFEPGFRSELHHKDLGIALAAGREYGVVLPVTAIVDQMLLSMRRKGWGGEDHSALLRIIEDLSQHEI